MYYSFRVALAVTVMAFTATAYAETTEAPDIHVGDRWVWQHTNGMADERDFTQVEDVVEVGTTEIRTRIRIKGKPGNGISTYTRDWNPKDVVSAQYEPYLKEFVFPLQVGKKWDGSADKMLFSNGKHGKFFMKGEVTAFEKVTVAAGTFDAYRITLVLDATSTDEDANIGHTTETFWYAPAVKRHVKAESAFTRDGRVRSKDIIELLDYSLR